MLSVTSNVFNLVSFAPDNVLVITCTLVALYFFWKYALTLLILSGVKFSTTSSHSTLINGFIFLF